MERFGSQVREDGFGEHIEQIDARGAVRPPDEVFAKMIETHGDGP